MTIDDQIKDEKLQYDINREVAKISALSPEKIVEYEYLTGEEILPSNQKHMMEQAKLTYFPLRKVFEKQIKTIEDQEKDLKDNKEKQIKAIEDKSGDKLSKQEKTFNKLLLERMYKIQNMSGQITLKVQFLLQ